MKRLTILLLLLALSTPISSTSYTISSGTVHAFQVVRTTYERGSSRDLLIGVDDGDAVVWFLARGRQVKRTSALVSVQGVDRYVLLGEHVCAVGRGRPLTLWRLPTECPIPSGWEED